MSFLYRLKQILYIKMPQRPKFYSKETKNYFNSNCTKALLHLADSKIFSSSQLFYLKFLQNKSDLNFFQKLIELLNILTKP